MKTLAILLALSGSVAAATDDEIRIAMAMATATERERGVELPPPPEPAPAANIFADYPDVKLRAALQPPAQPSRYTSPPGYHRHVATDGTVIEHSDSNNYKPAVTPAAHQNLVQSADGTWPQYTGPRAPTVRLPYATGYQPVLGVGYCPPGRP